MITREDIELIAMILQRAPVNSIEAQWINAKLDELRELVGVCTQVREKEQKRAGPAGSLPT